MGLPAHHVIDPDAGYVMSFPEHLLIHEVIRVRPAVSGPDSYGNTTRDYGAAATRAAVAARVQQDTRSESFPDGRQPAESMWMLFTIEDDIDRHDRFEWTDPELGLTLTFEVHGRPEPTYSDAYHHTETQLRILEG